MVEIKVEIKKEPYDKKKFPNHYYFTTIGAEMEVPKVLTPDFSVLERKLDEILIDNAGKFCTANACLFSPTYHYYALKSVKDPRRKDVVHVESRHIAVAQVYLQDDGRDDID